MKEHKSFFEDLNQTHKGSLQQLVYYTNRLLIVIVLVVITEYPCIQCIVILYAITGKNMYTFHANPYRSQG